VQNAPHLVRPLAAPGQDQEPPQPKARCTSRFAKKYAADWTEEKLSNLRQQLAKHIKSGISKNAFTKTTVNIASLPQETDIEREDLMAERMEVDKLRGTVSSHHKEIIGTEKYFKF